MITLPSGKKCKIKEKYPYGGVYNQYNSLFNKDPNYDNTINNLINTYTFGLTDNYIYKDSPNTKYNKWASNINNRLDEKVPNNNFNNLPLKTENLDPVLDENWTNFANAWELGTNTLFGFGQDLYNNKLMKEKAKISQRNYREEPFTRYDNFNNFYNPLNSQYMEDGGTVSGLELLDLAQNNDIDNPDFIKKRNSFYKNEIQSEDNNLNIENNSTNEDLENAKANTKTDNINSNNQFKSNKFNINTGKKRAKAFDYRGDPIKMETFSKLLKEQVDLGNIKPAEMFYDPIKLNYNHKRGYLNTPIGKHSKHGHFATQNYDEMLKVIELAKSMGLEIREDGVEDEIDPVHTDNSYHYQLFEKGGIVDNEGYRMSNIHNFTPMKIINSNYIDTNNMSVPAIDANGQILYNNTGTHYIPGNGVIEKPIFQDGGIIKLPSGKIVSVKNKAQNGQLVLNPKVKKIREDAVKYAYDMINNNNYYDLPESFKNSVSDKSQLHGACISGVCGPYSQAGIQFKGENLDSQILNNRFLSNTDFAKNAKLNNFGHPRTLQNDLIPGDLLQQLNGPNKSPSHAMLILKNDGENVEYLDNYHKKKGIKSVKELNEWLKNGDAQYFRYGSPTGGRNISNDPEIMKILNEENARLDKEGYTFNEFKNVNTYYNQANDNENIYIQKINKLSIDNEFVTKMAKKYNLTKQQVQNQIKLLPGVLKQESNYGNPNILDSPRSFWEQSFEKIQPSYFTSDNSVGPAQIKYESISQDLRDKYNIKSSRDLYNPEIFIPLTLEQNLSNRNWIAKKKHTFKEKGISNLDITEDNIDEFTMYARNQFPTLNGSKKFNPTYKALADYRKMYKNQNSVLKSSEIDKLSDEELWKKVKDTKEFKERFKHYQLNLDKDSYPNRIKNYSNQIYK